MLEVFRVRGPGNRCQTWLDSRKYTAEIKFPKSRQGLNCSGFQRASLCLNPVLGVVSLSWGGAWHSEAVGSAVSLIILASWARNSQGFSGVGKGGNQWDLTASHPFLFAIVSYRIQQVIVECLSAHREIHAFVSYWETRSAHPRAY